MVHRDHTITIPCQPGGNMRTRDLRDVRVDLIRDPAAIVWIQHFLDGLVRPRPVHVTPRPGPDLSSTSTWFGAEVNHNQFFPLTGSHTGLDCESCHINGVFAGTPRDCVGCHRADYDATSDPNHAQAGFPTDCESCHTTATWLGAETDHSFFPLTGSHRNLDCESCHDRWHGG